MKETRGDGMVYINPSGKLFVLAQPVLGVFGNAVQMFLTPRNLWRMQQ